MTYLFTDLKDSTAMYDQVGDATAYNLVRRHFDVLARAVADYDGAVVKTVGDAIMATFVRPVNAVSAARAMMEAWRRRSDYGRAGPRQWNGDYEDESAGSSS